MQSLLVFSRGSISRTPSSHRHTTHRQQSLELEDFAYHALDGCVGTTSQQLRKRLCEASETSLPLTGLAFLEAMERLWSFFGGPIGCEEIWRQAKRCVRKLGVGQGRVSSSSLGRRQSRDLGDIAEDDTAVVHEDEVLEVARLQATQLESVKMMGNQRFEG